MRKSFAAAIALIAILAVAVPTTAAPSGKAPRQESTLRERGESPVMTAIRKMMKRFFGASAQSAPVMPIPKDNKDGNEG